LQEVKLSTTSAERNLYDSLAEIYSIITTLDALEKAYLKDSITEEDYTQTCSRLLKQYKSNLADETVSKAFGDLESFKREWDVCYYKCEAWFYSLIWVARWIAPAQLNVYELAYQRRLSKVLLINRTSRANQPMPPSL
jgi:hypothetical protein